MSWGFKISEVLSGTHSFINSNEQLPIKINITWSNLLRRILKGHFIIIGFATIGGLCDNAKVYGTLTISYLKFNKIIYKFNILPKNLFDTGYIFYGEKVNIKPWNLLTSHTTCFGTITDYNNKLISRAVLHFKFISLPRFLSSVRFVKWTTIDEICTLKGDI